MCLSDCVSGDFYIIDGQTGITPNTIDDFYIIFDIKNKY